MRLLILLIASGVSEAATYTFTKIVAESRTGPVVRLSPVLAMNADGTVAFGASSTLEGSIAGEGAVFTGSGGTLRKIADANGALMAMQVSSINDAGTVLFQGMTKEFVTGMFTGDGGAVGTVMLSTAQARLPSYPTLYGDISKNGDVVYRDAGRIVVRSNGVSRVVADSSVAGRFEGLSLAMSAQFNRNGSIVFGAIDASIRDRGGLFIDTGGTIKTVAEDTGPLRFAYSVYPMMNDAGRVVSLAWSDSGLLRGGVYSFADGKTETHFSGELRALNADINNRGEVVYVLRLSGDAPGGIYRGPDLKADKVLEVGDSLFGSTVRGMGIATSGGHFLNDKGQIAFVYALANGESGIAVATPEETGPGPVDGRPVLPVNAMLNAASLAASETLSAGAAVSLFGTSFAPGLKVAEGPILPKEIDGVSVTFNGVAAPLYFVAQGQINLQIPYEVAGTNAAVVVRNAAGVSETRTLALGFVSPAIYTVTQSGGGQGAVVFANTGTLADAARPARAGDTLTIYASGMGAVAPGIASGVNSCGGECAADGSNLTLRRVATTPSVLIGGTRIPAANVLFAGLAPQFVGLYQVNFTLPAGTAKGNAVAVVLEQGAARSRTDVTMAIQ